MQAASGVKTLQTTLMVTHQLEDNPPTGRLGYARWRDCRTRQLRTQRRQRRFCDVSWLTVRGYLCARYSLIWTLYKRHKWMLTLELRWQS